MPKEKGKKHKEILKCQRCRLDKQKCLPEGRKWPVAKCKRCEEHGYACSAPLSARNEKIEREAEEEELFQLQHRAASLPKSKSQFRVRDAKPYDYPASSTSPSSSTSSALSISRIPRPEDLGLAKGPGNTMFELLSRRSMVREPPAYRIMSNNDYQLMERYSGFWGSPMTFGSMCSPEFGEKITKVFNTDTRQVSLLDDMTNNAVIAFSAALTQSPQSPIFSKMTHVHAMKAMTSLRVRLKETWPYLNDASIVLTAFNLFCYGLCTSDSSILQFMTAIIQTYHQYNTGFPINAEIVTGEDGFWIVRLFMQDNPEDRGLIMRHDTNTFEKERVMYEEKSGFYSPKSRKGSPIDAPSPILASNVNPVVTLTVTDIAAEVMLPVTPSSQYSSPPPSAGPETEPLSADTDHGQGNTEIFYGII